LEKSPCPNSFEIFLYNFQKPWCTQKSISKLTFLFLFFLESGPSSRVGQPHHIPIPPCPSGPLAHQPSRPIQPNRLCRPSQPYLHPPPGTQPPKAAARMLAHRRARPPPYLPPLLHDVDTTNAASPSLITPPSSFMVETTRVMAPLGHYKWAPRPCLTSPHPTPPPYLLSRTGAHPHHDPSASTTFHHRRATMPPPDFRCATHWVSRAPLSLRRPLVISLEPRNGRSLGSSELHRIAM
jgi:hypothetical protein